MRVRVRVRVVPAKTSAFLESASSFLSESISFAAVSA